MNLLGSPKAVVLSPAKRKLPSMNSEGFSREAVTFGGAHYMGWVDLDHPKIPSSYLSFLKQAIIWSSRLNRSVSVMLKYMRDP